MSYRDIVTALEELPVAVRSARRSRGMSLRKAAREMDMSFSTLDRFERRADIGVDIQLEPVIKILRWLDTQPSDLSFRCPGCGWSTWNREVEQHICPQPTDPS